MTIVKAFEGFLVKPEFAEQVVSPAYDSVSPAQRKEFADQNPDNFLNTMRLAEDFDPNAQPTQEALLDFNRKNLERLLGSGFFNEIDAPCLFVYQLASSDHKQTGLVCEVGVDEYERDRIKKHENTRSDKEDLLAHYQKVVGASSSPICLTYPKRDDIDKAISELTEQQADLDFYAEDGVRQRVWCITDTTQQQQLIDLYQNIDATYLTDGHHRAASGRRYAEIMREEEGNNGNEPYNQLLVALFPDSELNLLPFHRCVRDCNGKTNSQLVQELSENFEVTRLEAGYFEPEAHGEFGLFVNDQWYKLTIKPDNVDSNDPVKSLDVSILQNYILDPVFDIKDPRADPRLDYIAGIGGVEPIKQKISEGWAVALTCYATSITQLMDVADQNGLMPPKSTYFDPKPRSGIFVRRK